MKKETMKKLLALPKATQDKVWKQAMDRLKKESMQKAETLSSQDKKTHKPR